MTSTDPVRLKTVAIPSEHGGWSLTLEPVLLGLIVVPSGAGVALGVAALAAFLTRTPLKLVIGDRWRRRRLARTELAERVALGYVMVVALAMVAAAVTAARGFLLPLLLAAPLVVIGLWFDARSRSRRLIPELAGTIGIGSISAAIILAGGEEPVVAFGAWSIVTLRAVATIPFVRTQLARAKGRQDSAAGSDLAQAVAVVGGLVGWMTDLLPAAASFAVILLALVQVALARTPPPRAAVIGAQQVVLGLTLVLMAGLALAAP